MKQYRAHWLVLCVLAVIVLSGTHQALRNAINDMRFASFPRQATGDVVLVAIDTFSIEKIGVWPWPRSVHAALIDRLEGAGASDIVFDVDFSSPSNPALDQAFADALRRAGGSVTLPSFKQSVPDRGNGTTIHVNRPLPEFAQQAWSGVVNVAVEPDGLVRRYSFGETLDGTFQPSLGALLAGQYKRKEQSLLIDFSIRADTVPIVSYVDVLRGDPAAMKMLKNKKIIIGATAIELGDHFSVPNGGHCRPIAASAGRRIDPAGPCAAQLLRCRNAGRTLRPGAAHDGAVAPPVRGAAGFGPGGPGGRDRIGRRAGAGKAAPCS